MSEKVLKLMPLRQNTTRNEKCDYEFKLNAALPALVTYKTMGPIHSACYVTSRMLRNKIKRQF